MEKLGQYTEAVSEKQQFLDNHNMLLQSLLLSKQNAGTQPAHQNPEGIGNGPVNASEGISGAGSGDVA